MLVQSAITHKLVVVLASAHTTSALHVITTFRDITTSAYTPGVQVASTNGTSDVTITDAPLALTQRVTDTVSVMNRDTVSHTVTIKLETSIGTQHVLCRCVLAANERLEYSDGQGFRVLDANGVPKHSSVNVSATTVGSLNTVVLGSDVTNNNGTANTIQDVTGLSFACVAGERYWFKAIIHYTAAATTTGSRWSINGPASPTELRYRSEYSLTATTRTLNDGLSAYDAPAASNATSAATGSNIAIIEGFITPSSNGTFIVRFASEVLSSAIVAKAGSVLQWQRVA